MSKLYVQKFPAVWRTSGSLAGSGSTSSGSFASAGYARLVGMFIASASAKAGSGLRISQSADSGSNWDYHSDWAPSACSGSAFSVETVGNAVQITWRNGADDADIYRTLWQLRPV